MSELNNNEYASLKSRKPAPVVQWCDNLRTPKSIRINIFGQSQKVCSFNCPFCEYGKNEIRLNQVKNLDTLPALDEIIAETSKFIGSTRAEGNEPERIVIVGPGESSLHPKLSEFTEKILTLRDSIAPNCKLGIFVNGTYLDQRKTFNQIARYDEVYCKMDAGNDKVLKSLNSPLVRTSTERILESYRRLDNVILMSLFCDGEISNTSDDHLADWFEVIGIVKPKDVLLSTVTRVPWDTGISPLTDDALQIIAAKLRRKLGIVAKVVEQEE